MKLILSLDTFIPQNVNVLTVLDETQSLVNQKNDAAARESLQRIPNDQVRDALRIQIHRFVEKRTVSQITQFIDRNPLFRNQAARERFLLKCLAEKEPLIESSKEPVSPTQQTSDTSQTQEPVAHFLSDQNTLNALLAQGWEMTDDSNLSVGVEDTANSSGSLECDKSSPIQSDQALFSMLELALENKDFETARNHLSFIKDQKNFAIGEDLINFYEGESNNQRQRSSTANENTNLPYFDVQPIPYTLPELDVQPILYRSPKNVAKAEELISEGKIEDAWAMLENESIDQIDKNEISFLIQKHFNVS